MLLNEAHIITNTMEIYKGLAFEQVLYLYTIKKAENSEDVFTTMCIWKGEDSVVIGRNQNPLIESNLLYLLEHNILLARRDSGGGTVYQDKKNINICIISNEKENLVKKNLQNMVNTLAILGYACIIDDKHNIRYKQDKISGSAFRYGKNVQMHHYTLLLKTNLERLKNSITPNHGLKVYSKGIDSNRTSVCNLHIENKMLEYALIRYTKPEKVFHRSLKEVKNYMPEVFFQEYKRLKSKEWIFERSPNFSIEIDILRKKYLLNIKKFSICSIYECLNSDEQILIWEGSISLHSQAEMEVKKKEKTNKSIFDIIDYVQKKIWRNQ